MLPAYPRSGEVLTPRVQESLRLSEESIVAPLPLPPQRRRSLQSQTQSLRQNRVPSDEQVRPAHRRQFHRVTHFWMQAQTQKETRSMQRSEQVRAPMLGATAIDVRQAQTHTQAQTQAVAQKQPQAHTQTQAHSQTQKQAHTQLQSPAPQRPAPALAALDTSEARPHPPSSPFLY